MLSDENKLLLFDDLVERNQMLDDERPRKKR